MGNVEIRPNEKPAPGNTGRVGPVMRPVPEPVETADPAAEAEIIRRAKSGDEASFGVLMRSNYERAFRVVLAVVRNEADARDVCQEVWLTVWRTLKDYRGEARFATWLHAVATRRAIDHMRKRRRWFDRFLPFLTSEDSGADIEPASAAPDPREKMEDAERNERFERAIFALPAKHRAVLALREIEGLSYDEIATTLKCQPGTVMSRLFTARRLLAQKLGVTS